MRGLCSSRCSGRCWASSTPAGGGAPAASLQSGQAKQRGSKGSRSGVVGQCTKRCRCSYSGCMWWHLGAGRPARARGCGWGVVGARVPAGWALYFQGVPQTLCWLDSWVAQSSCPILLCRHGMVMVVMMVVMQSMRTMYAARQAVGFWLVVSTGCCAALLWSACCCGVFRCRWRFAAGILYRKWRCATTVGVIHMCQ